MFTYALVVDNLDNGGDSANVWAATEVDDTANLDLSPVWCLDSNVAHYAGVEIRWVGSRVVAEQ